MFTAKNRTSPYGQVTSKDIDFALEHIEEEKVSRPADPGLIESEKKQGFNL